MSLFLTYSCASLSALKCCMKDSLLPLWRNTTVTVFHLNEERNHKKYRQWLIYCYCTVMTVKTNQFRCLSPIHNPFIYCKWDASNKLIFMCWKGIWDVKSPLNMVAFGKRNILIKNCHKIIASFPDVCFVWSVVIVALYAIKQLPLKKRCLW